MGTRRTLKELEGLLLNKRFSRLVVLSHGRMVVNKRKWNCVCDCGNKFESEARPILTGRTLSCGCYTRDRMTSHGMSRSREYKSYFAMIGRCLNPRNKDYHNYGGRGVTVCKRWRESFENFLEDMGSRPEKTSLDKIDNDRPYGSDNCRWASDLTQGRNQRRYKYLRDGSKPG